MDKTAVQPVKAGQEPDPAPAHHSLSPLEEFDRMIEGFFERSWMKPFFRDDLMKERLGFFGQHNPKIDIVDRDKEIIVRAEMPGVDRKEIDVEITDHSLTIKGHRAGEAKEEKEKYYHSEMWQGSFARTVALPVDVDSHHAEATFKDGILTITLPKTKHDARRKLEVK
ncbi:Hsp20/alpha crystallin family protein [Halomonas sp. McH1-25]|uniref:Hsp20/alpha crystallin family protein n=1 Tax=unclassified Halomonas TaxID=2609666 RepID=UPI001EF539AF|nr:MULTISPECIES: Hsp20/alpha crystallin family protein [unclassified Halomonas]MCG7600874.1 Hsp20/alpha crystallin family protein [Halomonas sp. McH1-25]MCP1341462.1 Hsp20/alpha crystallin family protein [Halomonas sp. FL8]MCP1360053.1 Hsp20/alpha crystallin family protein [Halomonas sp. BBD45]MCP1364179.1 Hsp20/alpha crystallin family protein [Halomonas sp. BBD48]